MKFIYNIAIVALVSQASAVSLSAEKDLYGKRQIYDLDGDGVEDNVKRSRDELDDFYYPNQFGDAGDDIYNTHHGNLPGHLRLEEYEHAPTQVKLYKFAPDQFFDTHYLFGGSDPALVKAKKEAKVE